MCFLVPIFFSVKYSKDFIQRLKRGDRGAQHILYDAISAKMYGVCMRYTGNPELAKDILHDGFVKVFTSVKAYRGEGSFEGWVRKIIVNTALEFFRQRRNIEEVELNQASFKTVEISNGEYDINFFLKIVSDLPLQYRTVFNLYAIDEYSHSEIAEMLNITESTSKSNYSRAKAILRDKLENLVDFKYEEFIR